MVVDIGNPKTCYECLIRNQGYSGDGMKCGKTGSIISWYDGNRQRMTDCPLTNVKEKIHIGEKMDRPNMRSEVLEALGEYYKNDIDILVDCLRYLKEDDKVYDLGYCAECGAKLIVCHYREYHPEVDAYENMSDLCCPNCDFINNSTEKEGF